MNIQEVFSSLKNKKQQKMIKEKKIFIFTLFILSIGFYGTGLYAQTDSPYSRFGLGKLRSQAVGPLKGMGGIGYGVFDSSGANPLNPASYAHVDSLSLVLDFGVNFSNTRYKDDFGTYNRNSGGIDYVSFLFSASKRVAISAGFLPFSKTAYQLKKDATTEFEGNDISYTVLNAGSGGLSQLYLGASYQLPVKGLYLGANLSYLFGKIYHSQTVASISDESSSIQSYLPSEHSTLNVTTAKVDLGLQYLFPISKYRTITLGVVYAPKINATGALTLAVNPGDGSTEYKESEKVIDTGLPESFGFGFSIAEKERWLVGFDVSYEKWKDVRFSNLLNDGLTDKDRFNNRIALAVGGEYRKAIYSRRYLDKVKVRGGINYNNSYVNVQNNSKQPKGYDEYGATFGFGFPLYDRNALGGRISYLNLSFEYKHLKPDFKGMVSEDYFGVSLNMNVNELWFFKRKLK